MRHYTSRAVTKSELQSLSFALLVTVSGCAAEGSVGPAPGDSGTDAQVLDDASEPKDVSVGEPDVTSRAGHVIDVYVPATTPEIETLYIAGDFQEWEPASPSYALEMVDDRHYRYLFKDGSGLIGTSVKLKITRGSWETVETGRLGEEVDDRTVEIRVGESSSITVAGWADQTRGDAGSQVQRLTDAEVLGGRGLWVYTPAGYHQSQRAYPLLLMFDGQNLFDPEAPFGSWYVGETLDTLISLGEMEPIVVVGVEHGGESRNDEYTPWVDAELGGGGGEAHLAAIINEVLPWAEAGYRVLGERRGLGGSSLGGLMALYGAYTRGDKFSRYAVVSPSLWVADGKALDLAEAQARPEGKLWLDMGTTESSLERAKQLGAILEAKGFTLGDDLRVEIIEGGEHTEAAWAHRFPDIMRFLYPLAP